MMMMMIIIIVIIIIIIIGSHSRDQQPCLFNGNKGNYLHNNRVQFPEDWVVTPTWRTWRHVITKNKYVLIFFIDNDVGM